MNNTPNPGSPEAKEQPVSRLDEIRERITSLDPSKFTDEEWADAVNSLQWEAIGDIKFLLSHIDKLQTENNKLRNPETYESTQKVAPPPEMY